MFTSYAQNFEDVMLSRALRHVERGLYIDIGAADPLIDSVSLAFHQRGWRGIHVEPLAHHAAALRQARPGDIVLETAIGETRGWLDFFTVVNGDGLSTGDPAAAARHEASGFEVIQSRIPCRRLADVLDEHAESEVHWLKIDVESLEEEVIRGWSPSPVRPWIVVVEATEPLWLPGFDHHDPKLSHMAWEPLLVELGYRFVYFDGLNRFYVSSAHDELAAAFKCGPNIFDGFVISPWNHMWQPRPEAPKVPSYQAPPPVLHQRPLRRYVLGLLRKTLGPALRVVWKDIASRPKIKSWLLVAFRPAPRLVQRLRTIAEPPTGTMPASHTAAEGSPPRTPSVVSAHRLIEEARRRRQVSSTWCGSS